jgi:hypothetical protein
MKAGKAVVGLWMIAFASTSCLGTNPARKDLSAQINAYPFKGQNAIDPHDKPGVIAPTFIDGPSEFTAHIVNVLVAHNVQGTFFVTGANIANRRSALELLASTSQQVGNGSYYQEVLPTLSEAVFKHRVLAVKDNIRDTDRGRLYFRFPFGSADDEQLRWLSEIDIDGQVYRPVGWHADFRDYDFNSHYPEEPGGFSEKDIFYDAKPSCEGQPNPFQHDYVGWTQFLARKTKGGVVLFREVLITFDRLDEILSSYESPKKYWASVPSATREKYLRYYACEKVDPNLRFTFEPLWGGAWPSLRE